MSFFDDGGVFHKKENSKDILRGSYKVHLVLYKLVTLYFIAGLYVFSHHIGNITKRLRLALRCLFFIILQFVIGLMACLYRVVLVFERG